MADDLSLDEVAGRLGKSRRWLQARLQADRVAAQPRFVFHHYLGRSPRWDESEYRALRAALIEADTRQRRSGGPGDALAVSTSSQGMAIGTWSEQSPSGVAVAASERALNLPRQPETAPT